MYIRRKRGTITTIEPIPKPLCNSMQTHPSGKELVNSKFGGPFPPNFHPVACIVDY
jgi:hypothetical protein